MSMQNSSKEKTSHYIVAWVVMVLVNNIIATIISTLLPKMFGSYLQEAYFWHYILAPIFALTPIISFYLTYQVWFSHLNGWRVLPWLYILGTLGFLGSTGNSLPVISKLIGQQSSDTYAHISVVAWFVSLYIIRNVIVEKSGKIK